MIAQTVLNAMPDAVFTWVVRRQIWLQRRLKRVLLTRAEARALARFHDLRPDWGDSLFDEHFLSHAAAPLLERYLEPGGRATAPELAACWFAQMRRYRTAPTDFFAAVGAAADFLRLLEAELASHQPQAASAPAARPPLPPTPSEGPNSLFAAALRERSNLEMDWLWLASQVASESERRYCLEQALFINPQSEAAQLLLCERRA